MASEPKVSNAFQVFLSQAPTESQAWMRMVKELDGASPLDEKTKTLAYIAVLASLRMTSGIPFHVLAAKRAGASRQEVIVVSPRCINFAPQLWSNRGEARKCA